MIWAQLGFYFCEGSRSQGVGAVWTRAEPSNFERSSSLEL